MTPNVLRRRDARARADHLHRHLEDPGRKGHEFEDAAREFVDLVAKNEPQLIAYSVYIDGETSEATVVQIHRDSESIEFHMEVAGPQFGRFIELYEPGGRIDVHGRPANHVLDRMRQMGQQFGVTVDVKEPCAGFVRLRR